MKKSLITLLVFFTSVAALADNDSYFTLGVNDTLLIHPAYSGQSYWAPVKAHFESRFDSWSITVTYPNGISYEDATRDSGMNVPYVQSDGTSSLFEAVLTLNDTSHVYSSTIMELGYWDNDHDGNYQSYGTVKWEPGDYNSMFQIELDINSSYRQGNLVLSGELTSTSDDRGGTGYSTFEKTIKVIVGYRKGDVNGDGYLDAGDVTAITAFALGNRPYDDFQLAAGDMNGDGILDLVDVTAVIALVLGE